MGEVPLYGWGGARTGDGGGEGLIGEERRQIRGAYTHI